QHFHQQLPQEAARTEAGNHRRDQGLATRRSREAHVGRDALSRDRSPRSPARQRHQAGTGPPPERLPGSHLPRRHRGIRLQGGRRADEHTAGHGDVPPAPGPPSTPRDARRPRPCTRNEGARTQDGRDHHLNGRVIGRTKRPTPKGRQGPGSHTGPRPSRTLRPPLASTVPRPMVHPCSKTGARAESSSVRSGPTLRVRSHTTAVITARRTQGTSMIADPVPTDRSIPSAKSECVTTGSRKAITLLTAWITTAISRPPVRHVMSDRATPIVK